MAQLTVVLHEDVSNLGAIQQSLDTGLLRSIPSGCQERRIYQFHEEIDRRIGVENVPAELRVTPVTGPYVET